MLIVQLSLGEHTFKTPSKQTLFLVTGQFSIESSNTFDIETSPQIIKFQYLQV